ncbi:MAG TPA: quinolinate synthase NadA [Acidimicrobiales bacterium]|nr:quinolinate synthase NadA [Acidimicrobiales bacterium]
MTETKQSELPSDFDSFARDVRSLARERNAIVLAHNYQVPWIQDVADYVGDSLALSRIAAESDAETIVFCGVHFMAETAKILSPEKTVLIPDPNAGCSLADTITAEQVVAWKREHPGAIVVAYVNTSAAVKAEVDLCCTSSNAVDIVESLPEDAEILFLPDYFLGAHVARMTGRNVSLWMGECHVHAGITPVALRSRLEEFPDSQLLVHPECGCTSAALYLVGSGEIPVERTHIVSTGSMVDFAKKAGDAHVLVATETGIIHQLQAANPRATFEAVNPAAVCRYMKMITPEKLLNCLRDREMTSYYEVTVDEQIRSRALKAVEAMIAIGTSSSFGE